MATVLPSAIARLAVRSLADGDRNSHHRVRSGDKPANHGEIKPDPPREVNHPIGAVLSALRRAPRSSRAMGRAHFCAYCGVAFAFPEAAAV